MALAGIRIILVLPAKAQEAEAEQETTDTALNPPREAQDIKALCISASTMPRKEDQRWTI